MILTGVIEEHTVEAVAGDLAKRFFNDLLPKAWEKFLFSSVLVDYARRPECQFKSLPPMFKFAGEHSKKGIADAQRRHMLDGIIFRNGVVKLNSVGVFIIVRNKGLKER